MNYFKIHHELLLKRIKYSDIIIVTNKTKDIFRLIWLRKLNIAVVPIAIGKVLLLPTNL
jgi:hypothetical protein